MASTTFQFRTAPALAAICLGTVLSGGPVIAQWGGGWGGGWGMGNWASTAQQGAADGIAAVVRSEGYANLKNSEAAKNWQEARSMDIDNKMKWTETYFEMRKTNREARAAEEGPPVTQEQAIRMAKMAAPPRLGSTQLDPVTGHIEYPLVLRDDIFAPNRQEVDALFAKRAASGGSVQYEEVREMQDAVSKFIDVLRQNVGNYAAGDYGRARTFLDSLAREARMPAG
ncbi:MAG: hypothetical protein ACKOB1_12715 [Planctomycetia bacterium]